MNSLLTLIKYLPLVALLTLTGGLFYEKTRLTDKLVTSQARIVNYQQRISILEASARSTESYTALQNDLIQQYMANNRTLAEANATLNATLEGYKQREEVVIARPGLVERRANSAVSQLMLDYACTTGATNRNCPEDDN